MRLLDIRINNFQGARDVSIPLYPLTLIAGDNDAGKSSIRDALRIALTGEVDRVSLKRDWPHLITEGAKKAKIAVALETDAHSGFATVELPSGKRSAPEASPLLSLLLEPAGFAALSIDERRTLLYTLAGISIAPAALRERLQRRGVAAAQADALVPLALAGFPAAQKHAEEQAREAKAAWRVLTGETWGSDKADGWRPEVGALPDPATLLRVETRLAELTRQKEDAMQALGAAKASQQQQQITAERRAALQQTLAMAERTRRKLEHDTAELQHWQDALAALPPAPGAAPAGLVLNCPCCGETLRLAGSRLLKYEPTETEAPEVTAQRAQCQQAVATMQRTHANTQRDWAQIEAAQAQMAALPEVADLSAELAAIQQQWAALSSEHDALATQQRALSEMLRQASAAEQTERQAKRLHVEVMAWIDAAAAVAPSGIPADLLADALQPVNARLRSHAEATGWAQVAVGEDMVLLVGGRPYRLASESGRWRADAMLAATLAELSGVRLLLLDRLDVLAPSRRSDALRWLHGLSKGGTLDTILTFATLKEAPPRMPEGAVAHWLERGVCVVSSESPAYA